MGVVLVRIKDDETLDSLTKKLEVWIDVGVVPVPIKDDETLDSLSKKLEVWTQL